MYQIIQFALHKLVPVYEPDAFALISFSAFAFIAACVLAFQVWLLFVIYEALNNLF